MNALKLNTLDLCWWLMRFSLWTLVSFVVWGAILARDISGTKLIITTVAAAILAVIVSRDACMRRRPLWLFPLATRGQPLRISVAQSAVVVLWFAGFYSFLWWFVMSDVA